MGDCLGRKRILWVATMTLLIGCATEPAPRSPNVLLIMIDTLRADRMSLHGHDRPTTPHLERFARTAVTFDRAYSPSSWTRASVASFFTGLHPTSHGCETVDSALDSTATTLAELLRERGYVTAGFYANGNAGPAAGLDQGFDQYSLVPADVSYPGERAVASAQAVNAHATDWLAEREPDRPWFLFLLYIDPHAPYLPHPDLYFGPEHPEEFYEGSRQHLRAINHGEIPRWNQRRDTVRDLYDGEIANADRAIGEVLARLEREGLAENTVVVVTSDHGESLWDHGNYRGHGRYLYEELIHVPLMVRWPGRSEPGLRLTTPVQAFGVFGAIAEALELAPASSYQCRSLLPYLRGVEPNELIFAELRAGETPLRALIEWPQKVIALGTRITETHDLAAEPHEPGRPRPRDVPRAQAQLDSLVAMVEECRSRVGVQLSQPSPEELENLRALGYID